MTNTTNFLAIDFVRNYLRENYTTLGREVSLTFQKKDGTLRKMTIQADQKLLETIQGKRQHTNPLTKVVTEKLEDGTFQFRSIPLDRVVSFD